MAGRTTLPDGWQEIFIAARRAGDSVGCAATKAGVSEGSAYYHRNKDPELATHWSKRRPAGPASPVEEVVETAAEPGNRSWRGPFLEALVETSSIRASTARAGTTLAKVYKARRDDAGFAAKWRAALLEGYDNLEMELLGYFRSPQPDRRMDVASALRLLTAHRETVARERALREDEDEAAVLASIDKFIDDMRERRAANAAILIETRGDDGED